MREKKIIGHDDVSGFDVRWRLRYVEKQPGKFVGDTGCEKLPVEVFVLLIVIMGMIMVLVGDDDDDDDDDGYNCLTLNSDLRSGLHF